MPKRKQTRAEWLATVSAIETSAATRAMPTITTDAATAIAVMTPHRIGDLVWLNQGDIYPAEILEIRKDKAMLRVRGWIGKHWYPLSMLRNKHPITDQPAPKF